MLGPILSGVAVLLSVVGMTLAPSAATVAVFRLRSDRLSLQLLDRDEDD